MASSSDLPPQTEAPSRPLKRAAQVIVVSSVMFHFISYWRTAAVVLCDMSSTVYYIGAIVESAIGKCAPWFILAVLLFSYAMRAVYIESSALFVRGGVYRVVKEAMGGFLAKLSVSALLFDYVLTGPISGVSAGQYIVGLGLEAVARFTDIQLDEGTKQALKSWGSALIACAITLYFFRQNLLGIPESSDKALKIMMATTVMGVILLTWSLATLAVKGPVNDLPSWKPDLSKKVETNDAGEVVPKINPLTGEQEDPLGFLPRIFPSLAEKLRVPGNWLSLIGIIGVVLAFGHSILAMSGEETLAQVYREVESPKLPNFKKAAFIVFFYSFALTVGDRRQGWALLAAMLVLFIPCLAVCYLSEQAGNPKLTAAGADQTPSDSQSGGNMEGKEVRFGIANSALWASATTAASNGSVNSMHDSFTPLGGLIPLWLIQLGEVIFGGVGSGLYGLLAFAIVAVFVAGLMVGRTPEYLGKKIEAFEMKMASIIILIPPALLEGLEVIPPCQFEYHGMTLREVDVDAILARKPTLALVDELAHTNAEGSRHTKRWQDIEELCDAGIDVYSSLNVQHIESLNDIVAQITGVTVRETIPDHVFESADDLELADVTAEELLERLAAGKVYVPEQAERALKSFFQKANLVALRELSLRLAAQRLHLDVELARRERSGKATWATAERILVCVGPSPTTPRVIRTARRMAAALSAEWIAVTVEPTGPSTANAATREAVAHHLRLAEQLGAQTMALWGDDVAATVLDYARSRNVTKIVIGKTTDPRWKRILYGTVVDHLLENSGEIDVYVIHGAPEHLPRRAALPQAPVQFSWRPYWYALAVVLLCGLIAAVFFRWRLSEANLVMVFVSRMVPFLKRPTKRPLKRYPANFASQIAISKIKTLSSRPAGKRLADRVARPSGRSQAGA